MENIATTFPKAVCCNCKTLISILHKTVFLTIVLNPYIVIMEINVDICNSSFTRRLFKYKPFYFMLDKAMHMKCLAQ